MTYDNALIIWKNLIKKGVVDSKFIGKEKHTQRAICHPHILRKFYRSYLGDADLAEHFMGHSTALTRAYRQMKKEDFTKKYLHVMPNETFFSEIQDLSSIQEELKQKDAKIKKLESDMAARDSKMKSIIEDTTKKLLEAEKKKNKGK
jgi:hypothetical protein